MPLCEYQSCPQ